MYTNIVISALAIRKAELLLCQQKAFSIDDCTMEAIKAFQLLIIMQNEIHIFLYCTTGDSEQKPNLTGEQ